MIHKTIKTPCVGICSTGIGDNVCRGCKRFGYEVINWNSYSQEQKRIIDARLEHFLTQIVQSKLKITDEAKLLWQIEYQRVRVTDHRNLYCKAYELLKTGGNSITNPDDFGLKVQPEYATTPIKDLCKLIDTEFFTLSDAHYQRYFKPSETEHESN